MASSAEVEEPASSEVFSAYASRSTTACTLTRKSIRSGSDAGLCWTTAPQRERRSRQWNQIATVVETTKPSSSFSSLLQHSSSDRRQFWNTSRTPVCYG